MITISKQKLGFIFQVFPFFLSFLFYPATLSLLVIRLLDPMALQQPISIIRHIFPSSAII
jgi:hypothetical protein